MVRRSEAARFQQGALCSASIDGVRGAALAARHSLLTTREGNKMIKTGSQHIEMLKDGRQVYINGHLAEDVTAHPSFRRTVQSIGTLYDFQSRPDNIELMTFEVPGGGGE